MKWKKMTEEIQTIEPKDKKRYFHIPIWCFLIMSFLNLILCATCFSGVNAIQYHGETVLGILMMFVAAEVWPLYFFLIAGRTGQYSLVVIITIILIIPVYLSARFPKNILAAIAACLSIIIWFYIGFTFAMLNFCRL